MAENVSESQHCIKGWLCLLSLCHQPGELCYCADQRPFPFIKRIYRCSKKFLTRFLSANFRLPQKVSHYDGKGTSDYWDKDGKEDFPTWEHNQTLEKKKALVKQVRELKEEGWNNREIALQMGISRQAVARYLKPGYYQAIAFRRKNLPSDQLLYTGERL